MFSSFRHTVSLVVVAITISIFYFPLSKFNLSFYESNESDGPGSDNDEDRRPCFSSIVKSAGFLDKELAANGFTRNNQDEIQKFIETKNAQKDDASFDDEENSDEENVTDDCKETVNDRLESWHLEEDDGSGEGDILLMKRLNKERLKAITAAHGGRKAASINSYKHKGGKSSHNSKIQRQLNKW